MQLGWSAESVDFINDLLLRKPDKRLGSLGGAADLMNHPWLKYYPWKELESKTLLAPFIPEKQDNFEKKYCEKNDKITEETKYRYEIIAKKDKFKTAFLNFYYNKEEVIMEKKEKDSRESKPQLLQQAITTKTTIDMNATQLFMTTNMKSKICTNNSNQTKEIASIGKNNSYTPFNPQIIRKLSSHNTNNKQESIDLVRKPNDNDSNMNVDYLINNNSYQKDINSLLRKTFGLINNNNNNSTNIMNDSNVNNLSIRKNKEISMQNINNKFVSTIKNNKPFFSNQHFNKGNGVKSQIMKSSNLAYNDISIPPLIQINFAKENKKVNSNYYFNNNNNPNGYLLKLKTNKPIMNKFLNHNIKNRNFANNAMKLLGKSSSDCMLLKNKVLVHNSPSFKI